MRILVTVLSFLVLSCNQSDQYTYVHSDDQFIKVMADLYMSEQVVRNHTSKKDSIRRSLKDQIIAIHDIKDSSLFFRELETLMKDTKKYKSLSDSVVKYLDDMQIEINKRQTKRKLN